jgi:hypothetical protein
VRFLLSDFQNRATIHILNKRFLVMILVTIYIQRAKRKRIRKWYNICCSIFLVFCFCALLAFFLCLVCPMLSVSLDCPFLIAPLVFSHVYLYWLGVGVTHMRVQYIFHVCLFVWWCWKVVQFVSINLPYTIITCVIFI